MFQMGSADQVLINELLISLGLGIIWALAVFWLNRRKKVTFSLPVRETSSIRGRDVLIGFSLFIFMPSIFSLIIGKVYFYLNGHPFQIDDLSDIQMLGLNLIVLLLTYLILSLYYLIFLNNEQKRTILGTKSPWYTFFFQGAWMWFIVYPFVLINSALLHILILLIFHRTPLEQHAVEQFRSTMGHPLLLVSMGLTFSFLAPLAEEFLFRGLLQSWLKNKLKKTWLAIGLSALIFSFFHYSYSQGITNIELLTSLFLVGCFLGYLYEKYQTLWVSIGLHSMINGMSSLLISLGTE